MFTSQCRELRILLRTVLTTMEPTTLTGSRVEPPEEPLEADPLPLVRRLTKTLFVSVYECTSVVIASVTEWPEAARPVSGDDVVEFKSPPRLPLTENPPEPRAAILMLPQY
jgi:hypothetical protein